MKKLQISLTTGMVMVQWFFISGISQSYDVNWLVGYSLNSEASRPFFGLSVIGILFEYFIFVSMKFK